MEQGEAGLPRGARGHDAPHARVAFVVAADDGHPGVADVDRVAADADDGGGGGGSVKVAAEHPEQERGRLLLR